MVNRMVAAAVVTASPGIHGDCAPSGPSLAAISFLLLRPIMLARTPAAVRDAGAPSDVKPDKLSADRRHEVTVDRFINELQRQRRSLRASRGSWATTTSAT